MKIIHVIPNLKRGGAERLCIDICNQLKKQGNDVHIVTFSDDNEYPELIDELDIHVIPALYRPSIIKSNIIEVELLENFISDIKPDIIHSHLYEADLVLFQLKLNSSIKVISHIHSNRKELIKTNKNRSLKEIITSTYERKIYKKHLKRLGVTQVAISEDCQNFALNELKQSNSNVILLKNCIDFNKFKGAPKTINVDGGKLNLINIGRFVPKKAQEFLIEVATELNQRAINFNITFLGDGDQLKKITRKSKEAKLEDYLKFPGIVQNPEAHLKSAHIYIHSAKEEPFGLVLIEAMAAGLPVISTDGFGNRDIIKENQNGFMVWKRDPIEFCDRIQQLYENPALYKKMSEYSIKFASNFDVKNYVEKLMKIYSEKIN